MQLVVDGDMKVRDVVSRWMWSTHDATMYRRSRIYRTLAFKVHNGYIIGDKAYPTSTYLLNPFSAPQTMLEVEYNRRLARARVLVEMTIGGIKKRFAFLKGPTRVAFENTKIGVVACCVLWNFCKDRNDHYKEEGIDLLENENIQEDDGTPLESVPFQDRSRDRPYKRLIAQEWINAYPI